MKERIVKVLLTAGLCLAIVVNLLGALVLCGCIESEQVVSPQVKPLSAHLIPTKDTWKAAYGDTIETQIAWNLAVIRFDQKRIFELVQALHPADPNEVAK